MMHVICSKHGYRGIRANISCCQEKDKTVTPASSCSLSSTNRAENNVQTLVNFCSSKGKGQSIPHQITHVQICHKNTASTQDCPLVHRKLWTYNTFPTSPIPVTRVHWKLDFLQMSTIPSVHVGRILALQDHKLYWCVYMSPGQCYNKNTVGIV